MPDLKSLADILDIASDALPPVEIMGIGSSSSDIKAGYIFAALAGTKVHGAKFASAAVAAGAVAIITDVHAPDMATLPVPVFRLEDPRRALSLIAARLAGAQPQTMVAVTGTSGKTSVAAFTRQIFAFAGLAAASIGTTGISAPGREEYGSLTTPDPVKLHQSLAELAHEGVTHGAMEASSHGLDQRRLDGVHLAASAFTNLGHDHLDYHPTIESYLAAKMRLFDTLMDKGSPAIIFSDDQYSAAAAGAARAAGLDVRLVGAKGDFLILKRVEHYRDGQRAEIEHDGKLYEVKFPLAGSFQLWNGLVAAGLALAVGVEASKVFAALETLKGAPGRLDLAGTTPQGAPVYVDYAHKPEALENVLKAVRPFTSGRVVVVFGCGGDRDKSKRKLMGEIASRLADIVIVTDDNPRSETPATIRAEIMAASKGASEIGDRRAAIRHAINLLQSGDTLIVAGKGHETGQTIGSEVLPFSDHDTVVEAIADISGRPLLWSFQDLVNIMGGRPIGVMPVGVTGLALHQADVEEGDAFFAVKGETSLGHGIGHSFDGHAHITNALKAGAALLIVAEAKLPSLGRIHAPIIVVDHPIEALKRLARAARSRSHAKIIAIAGKTGAAEMAHILGDLVRDQGSCHVATSETARGFGLALGMAQLPQDAQFGAFAIDNLSGDEIQVFADVIKPDILALTDKSSVTKEDVATYRVALGSVVIGGTVLLNSDGPDYAALAKQAKALGVDHIKTISSHSKADYAMSDLVCDFDGGSFTFDLKDNSIHVKTPLVGMNNLTSLGGVFATAHLAGVGLDQLVQNSATLQPRIGTGLQDLIVTPKGNIAVIDEAARNIGSALGHARTLEGSLDRLRYIASRGKSRKILILGPLDEFAAFDQSIFGDALAQSKISDVMCFGDDYANLGSALDKGFRFNLFKTSDALIETVLKNARTDDILLLKANKNADLAKLVSALRAKYAKDGM